MTEVLRAAAPAKLNLFLRILAVEQNGYHALETLFCRIGLADDLEVERVDRPGAVELEVTGADTGPAEDNLVTRAARRVLEATRNRFGVRIRLVKRIPVAAGLGGGSSDAATTLDLVNQLSGGAVPRAELLNFAGRLGADVPFFLSGAPLALAWSHGDRMLRLPPLPPAPLLLLIPPVGVNTAAAYRWVDEARTAAVGRGSLALDLDSLSRWSDVARMAGNDFESAVFGREPRIREAFEALARTALIFC
ncbi:MAG: 4-(cytidine 5'-diphospho)-2-C-methyl-D-erythritol kinase [Gemmatimonadales bacterium]